MVIWDMLTLLTFSTLQSHANPMGTQLSRNNPVSQHTVNTAQRSPHTHPTHTLARWHTVQTHSDVQHLNVWKSWIFFRLFRFVLLQCADFCVACCDSSSSVVHRSTLLSLVCWFFCVLSPVCSGHGSHLSVVFFNMLSLSNFKWSVYWCNAYQTRSTTCFSLSLKRHCCLLLLDTLYTHSSPSHILCLYYTLLH